jgi:hypothetical protein
MKLDIINRESGQVISVEYDDYEYNNNLILYNGGKKEIMEGWIPKEKVTFCKVYSKDSTPYCEECAISMEEEPSLAHIEAPITCEGCNKLVVSDI